MRIISVSSLIFVYPTPFNTFCQGVFAKKTKNFYTLNHKNILTGESFAFLTNVTIRDINNVTYLHIKYKFVGL